MLEDDQRLALQFIGRKLMTGAHFSLLGRARQALNTVVQDTARSELAQLMNEDPKMGQRWVGLADTLARRLDKIATDFGNRRKRSPT